MLPDEDRNREFWKFTWGQALLTLGASFHYVALPKLAAGDKKDAGVAGNRAAGSAAQAASSLLTGPLVDRNSTQKVLVWTYVGRSLLMMAVPLLFFHGYLTFGAFLFLICAAGFLQSTSINAGSVAFNRILGDDGPPDAPAGGRAVSPDPPGPDRRFDPGGRVAGCLRLLG